MRITEEMQHWIDRQKVETLDAPNYILTEGLEICPICGSSTTLENNGEIHCDDCNWVYEG